MRLKQEKEKHTLTIKPSGRLILTIGSDLIKDPASAIIELVKNAYDADAEKVTIVFSSFREKTGEKEAQKLRIIVKDDGHGMTFDDVINKWLVPATEDKIKRMVSPKGRTMQGRKGIGRYAASILGNEFFMESITLSGEKTTVFIDWNDFLKSKYLEDVEILVEREISSDKPHGTKIEITGNEEKLKEWTKKEVEKLINELRKLLPPWQEEDDPFSIEVVFQNFPVEDFKDEKITIESYPLLELYDYRLSGTITKRKIHEVNIEHFEDKITAQKLLYELKEKGETEVILAELIYENTLEEIKQKVAKIILLGEDEKYCGEISIDLRVFDRDPEAIEDLIKRGLKDPDTGRFLGRREARKLLDTFCGVSIYRGRFRVRPYGDPGYDWLELDKRRVQNPSLHIGSNQIIGYITVLPEEYSHLEEKSSREGFKENAYYEGLKKLVQEALSELEQKRFDFRKRTGRGRKLLRIEEKLEKIFDFSELEKKLTKHLEKDKLSKESIEKISKIIKDEERKRNKTLEVLKETIALYQGQATLGKIVMVILHEGRKSVFWFRNQMPLMKKSVEKLLKNFNQENLELIKQIATDSITQANLLKDLFGKLDPLSVKKRGRKKEIQLIEVINKAYRVFEKELRKRKINFVVNCDKDVVFRGWEEDLLIALTNLVDNSIYWMGRYYGDEIRVECYRENGKIIIDYYNNGPPIEKELIEKELIFEPGFSKKENGTGIGLAIAGEAIARNDGVLKATYSKNGAYFRIELGGEE